MLRDVSGFSRARSLLQGADNGDSARSGPGEADVEPHGSGLSAIERSIAESPDLDVVEIARIAARSGTWSTWPDDLDPRLLAALAEGDLARPYRHQENAVRAVLRGRDVVVATSTASGKSLCYQVPLVDAALRDDGARALLLFPTKALARDQLESLRKLTSRLAARGCSLGVAPYDGDTPPDERRAARARAHVVATNPDMLHRGILPGHDRWSRFLAGLRLVVIDELHVYRGLFGSHVGNVLRRLLRICAHHGSRPRIVACSATIANPGELAAALTGRPLEAFTTIASDDAPAGPRTFMVVNPKVVDAITGVRRDYLKVTRSVATVLRRSGAQTLTFCRTRKAVELITRYLQEDEARELGPAPTTAIRGYRGGYLPDRRRAVERALREGEARIVATTNALELGVDLGGIDCVLLSGYPGTRAATLQRAGRAGRRGRASLCVMVLSSAPLDQLVAADPSFVLGGTVEHARVDPANPEVFLPHLHCAAWELPMRTGDAFADADAEVVKLGLAALAAKGALAPEGDEWIPLVATSPAEQVDLRGTPEHNFAVVDEASGSILAEVAFEDGPLYLHPGAIHAVEGRTHEVRRLDWDGRKAFVRAVAADYYTEAIAKLRVRIVDPHADEGALHGIGGAHVVRQVPGFKKIRFDTHENIGFGPIALPDLEVHTVGAFWAFPRGVAERVADPPRRAAAALAAAHAIHHVAAMVLMCDVADLGHAVLPGHPSAFGAAIDRARGVDAASVLAAGALPYFVLFDRASGGAGLATAAHGLRERFFARVSAAVAGCRCARGCPTCMGPASDDEWGAADRADVLAVLDGLARMVAPAEARA